MWLDGKNDITPETWDELNEILYDIPKTLFNRYRSDFVYRGLANKAWELETSLIRLKAAPNIERPMFRSFLKFAEPGSLPSNNLWI